MSDTSSPASPSLRGFDLAFPLPSRVSIIIVCGIWAWGLNLYFLTLLRIDVPSLIKYTSRSVSGSPHYQRIFRLAWTASILLFVLLTIYWIITHGDSVQVLQWEILPISHLILLVALFVLPLQRLSKNGRYRFLSTLRRISVGGIAETQDGKFGDILLADALTSYAKVLGDLVASICMFLTPGENSSGSPNRSCGSPIIVPFIVSIPSLIRLRQCLIEYSRVRQNHTRSSGWGGQHLANALKYSTAFPVIAFNAMQRRHSSIMSQQSLTKLWVGAATINSSYSFYWDIAKDWDLTLFSWRSPGKQYPWGLRKRLFFRPYIWYYFAITVDLLLRFTWTTRLSSWSERIDGSESGIFLIEILEVSRRWLWIFFRVETEWIRTQDYVENNVLLDIME